MEIRKTTYHDCRVSKGHDLARNHASETLLSVTPPEQIWKPSPPSRSSRSPCRPWMLVQEECQAPALRQVPLRIEFRQWVGQVALGGVNTLATKIGHIWDLPTVRVVPHYNLSQRASHTWFVNISSTVSFFKILFPLPGWTPSFSSVAMIWQYSAGFAKHPAPPALKVVLMSAGSCGYNVSVMPCEVGKPVLILSPRALSCSSVRLV